MQKRIQLSIGLLSISIIAFQLILMQILSIVQWYHFAYMVISVALLGFGTAGTFLSIFKKKLLSAIDVILPILMITSGLAMTLVIRISQTEFIRFDSYLTFADLSQIWKLLLTYLLYIFPFFLSALAIGITFVKYPHSIGKLYFYNLSGSAFGGIVAIGLIWRFLPHEIPAIISIIPLVAGLIIISKKIIYLFFVAVITVIIIVVNIFQQNQLVLSEFKSLTKTLNLPEAEIKLSKNSPYGFMQFVTSPALRYAPGLSLNFTGPITASDAVFSNGDWYAPIIHGNLKNKTSILDYTTISLPYYTGEKERVLILESKTGYRVFHALTKGAKNVVAVEPNSLIISLLKNELAGKTDSLFFNPKVSIKNIDSRTFLMTDTLEYDLITLPIIGSFGGSSGLYALQEEYNLTVDAFRQIWNKLSSNGLFSVTCWMDQPYRNPLKILSTIVETLNREGIENPVSYIAAVRSWGTITFIVKKSPILINELNRIRQFCKTMFFDPALLPDIVKQERTNFNKLQNEEFFQYIDEILKNSRAKFYTDYAFKIEPATDNRPYFSQFLKFRSLPKLSEQFGNYTAPYFEIGYIVLILTFFQIIIASFLLIIVPLFKTGWRSSNKLWTFTYFSGIGMGYMFVEIVFIQRFILYFGNSIYSVAAVISSMLICSGAGSYFSSFLKAKRGITFFIFGTIVALILIYSVILFPVLKLTISFPFIMKLLIAILIISPLAFLMGIPFPAGINLLVKKSEDEIPWAWGINGCFSVVSTVSATIIGIEFGFTSVILLASLAYCLPLFANLRIKK
ncbi:MAG: spermidine synthase-like protein [Bacteroidota bacterium]